MATTKRDSRYPASLERHAYRTMSASKQMLDHITALGQHAKGTVWKDTDERDIVLAQLRDAFSKQREVEEMLRRASTFIDNRTT